MFRALGFRGLGVQCSGLSVRLSYSQCIVELWQVDIRVFRKCGHV